MWFLFFFLLLHTNDCEELIGAAVREKAAHNVWTGEGGQTLLTVLMGLEVSGSKQNKHRSVLTPTLFANSESVTN